jgi:type IV secretion system protein VirB10
MRRDRQIVPVSPEQRSPDVRTQRIVIEGRQGNAARAIQPALPRYYSSKDDAQLAQTLRTMKIQAITARPVVENFNLEGEGKDGRSEAQPSARGGQPGYEILPSVNSAAMAALAGQQGQAPDPNGQAQKQNFLRGENGGGSFTPQGYSANLPVPRQFPFELKVGTIIPGTLISGINSDLPGNVLAQVSENVWDTATGKHILIPKGTRIIGVYDSQVSFGQKRVLLVWNRLIFPNGMTLNIAGSPGADQAGYSGLSGRVNEHWGEMFKAALLASMFVAGAEIVYNEDNRGQLATVITQEKKSVKDAAAESLASSILDMSAKIMNRASDIQPTITIRPGKKIAIFVQQDVVFPFPYF